MSGTKNGGDVCEILGSILMPVISSRHEAADVLQRVAEKGQWGCWPDDVTCEQVGRALFRIAMNAHEENALAGILRGWVAAKRERGL